MTKINPNIGRYHFSRQATVQLCDGDNCDLGGFHYGSYEEAEFTFLDLGMIHNHYLQLAESGGYICACGERPESGGSFDGLRQVQVHAKAAHAQEVAEAKVRADLVLV